MPKKPVCCTIDDTQIAMQESDAELARLATAMGHPARIAIVRFLKAKGVCICGEIVEVLPLSQSTVSQHLKTLKDAGLVQGETDGPRVCYCLNPEALERLGALLGEI